MATNTSVEANRSAAAPLIWAALPARMKVLFITTLQHQRKWLDDALASDNASRVELSEAIGLTIGLTRLREEAFDAVLVLHQPEALDAVEAVAGLRAGGHEQPLVVLSAAGEPDLAPLCYEAGADDFCAIAATTTRELLWTLARSIERRELLQENGRLRRAEHQRLDYEHQETERLLAQQRLLVEQLEQLRQSGASGEQADAARRPDTVPLRKRDYAELHELVGIGDLPPALVQHYRDLLRAYVIMGTGNLAREMSQLAELLAAADLSARQAMHLHVQVLEELVHHLGSRSARHVMNRADLLVLELLIHLADRYRRQFRQSATSSGQKFSHRLSEDQQLRAA